MLLYVTMLYYIETELQKKEEGTLLCNALILTMAPFEVIF